MPEDVNTETITLRQLYVGLAMHALLLDSNRVDAVVVAAVNIADKQLAALSRKSPPSEKENTR